MIELINYKYKSSKKIKQKNIKQPFDQIHFRLSYLTQIKMFMDRI